MRFSEEYIGFEVERPWGEDGDVKLSDGVDWMHTFLIAMIQKGGNVLYHPHITEESCRLPEFNINPKQKETQE